MNKAIYYLSYKLTINGEEFVHSGNCVYGMDYNREWNPVKFDSFDELWAFVHGNNVLRSVYADTTLFRKRKIIRTDIGNFTARNFGSAVFEVETKIYEGKIRGVAQELSSEEFLEYCYDRFIETKKEQNDVAREK